ncbi:MAG TPA: LPS export ABC transporter permease LptG, partial [Casimicrobiaceae bacterium]|nr:LPS export ABC transporter permease LptG [Casimicrobiaceae bacterium]
MPTLARYIGREVLNATLIVFIALIALFAFFDVINELGDVGKGNYSITSALSYVALHLPARAYELFPVSALIGTLFAISQLVGNSEYTVMRVSGASLVQVGWAVVRIGIPLALATFLAGEFVAPPAERLAQSLRASARGDTSSVVAQQFDSGFWFKEESKFVNVRSVLADLTLIGVRIFEFDEDLRLRRVRNAESGRFTGPGRWQLASVRTTEFVADTARVSTSPDYAWDTVLRPSILTVYQVSPERLELATLWDNISVLSDNAQKTSRFEIAFWNKIFYPGAVLVMMIVALPFAHFQRRSGGIGVRIFTGTMIGLTFYLCGRLFSNLGVLHDWPPLFAAAFPLVVFSAVGVFLLWYIARRS